MITDRQMQAAPQQKDIWLSEDGPRGAGRLVARITPSGERVFYFRYTTDSGQRDILPIGSYDAKGRSGMKLAEARVRAGEWSKLYQAGTRNLRQHFAAEAEVQRQAQEAERRLKAEALQQQQLEDQRRLTVRQLFDRWALTELTPRTLADGTRTGRKDGGDYSRAQFERRVFPRLGSMASKDVSKADVMAILDAVKAEGKLRTCNVLLTDLKQMFQFALTRDIIDKNPLASITKRQAGGKETERDRALSPDEIKLLFDQIPQANLAKRTACAVGLILSTGCRVGELVSARWEHVDLDRSLWHLPETKNQRPHRIHLSNFAKKQFEVLAALRVRQPGQDGLSERLCEWVFPNTAATGPLDVKTIGKQLADRQRSGKSVLSNRTAAAQTLSLPGGRWTAHDLRRTAATTMARLGVSADVIDECLNHMIENRVTRTYIRDRREAQQRQAFDALGEWLSGITTGPGLSERTT